MRSSSRVCSLLVALAAVTAAETGSQTVFASVEHAAQALLSAVESGDYALFLSVAGTQMAQFWESGDLERDILDRQRFLNAARDGGIKTDLATADRKMLYVGDSEQPFPAPLVRRESGWTFDDIAGNAEVQRRRTRRNETAIVELCQRFRDAEFEYFELFSPGSAVFADRIRSTPGRRNGLFWSNPGGEDESPLGPSFAAAAFGELSHSEGLHPLFGYYFKILTAQGPKAVGGALDYRVKGRMRAGFALIAWPARYRIDGVRSFLINHLGDVYQKDLGPATRHEAECMTVFNPDRTWSRLEREGMN